MFTKTLCIVALAAVLAGDVQGVPVMSWFPWPSWGDKSNNQNLNWVLDEILKSIKHELILEGGDQIELANSALNTTEELDALWWKVRGTVTSDSNGNLKNLSSVIRSSDAGINQDVKGGSLKDISLNADLSLNELEVDYPSVNVQVGLFSYNGGLSVKCSENAFNISVQFSSQGDSCPTSLQAASIKKLQGCSVKLSQGGVLNWFKQHVFSLALSKVVDAVKETESRALPVILEPIVKQHNLCKFLNPANAS